MLTLVIILLLWILICSCINAYKAESKAAMWEEKYEKASQAFARERRCTTGFDAETFTRDWDEIWNPSAETSPESKS